MNILRKKLNSGVVIFDGAMGMIKGRTMEICRETLFHSYRRTSASDISCNSQKVLHRNHLHLLVA